MVNCLRGLVELPNFVCSLETVELKTLSLIFEADPGPMTDGFRGVEIVVGFMIFWYLGWWPEVGDFMGVFIPEAVLARVEDFKLRSFH